MLVHELIQYIYTAKLKNLKRLPMHFGAADDWLLMECWHKGVYIHSWTLNSELWRESIPGTVCCNSNEQTRSEAINGILLALFKMITCIAEIWVGAKTALL